MPNIIKVQGEDSLMINEKVYSLSEAPEWEDDLVQDEVSVVLGMLCLRDVTENLDLAIELFYVAYHGVAGAKDGSVRAEIAALQSDLSLLCNECILTMITFHQESREIISQIVNSYKYLIKGMEGLAIKKLERCKDSSVKMSNKAKNLSEEFKILQRGSTKARSKTIIEETEQEERKKAAERAERNMIADQKAAETTKELLDTSIAKMESNFKDAQRREEKESDRAFALEITSAITSAIGSGLGAYMATKNPLATLAVNASSTSGDGETNTQFKEAQEKENECKKLSSEVKGKLLKAKDEQSTKKAIMDKLQNELDKLTTDIASKEKDASVKEDELAKLKEERDTKQVELTAAEKDLTSIDTEIKELETTDKDYTAAHNAAAKAIQDLAVSTGQMTASAVSAEASIHDEKMEYFNAKLEMEKERRETLGDLAKYAEAIKNCEVEQGDAKLSVNSLHAAVDALGKIIATLTDASLFWDQMADHCGRMANQGFQEEIAYFTDPENGVSPEERIAEYRDPQFMWEILHYMSQWVALNGISAEYITEAEMAQKKNGEYLSQSPTIEEAIRKAPELSKNLNSIIERDLKKSYQKSVEYEQQIAYMEA